MLPPPSSSRGGGFLLEDRLENRPYQTEALYQLNTLLNHSRHPVYLAPCGTGKTYTAAKLIEDRNYLRRRVWVLVPQVEIFSEWMRVLSEHGLNPGYINDEGVMGRDRSVYVCMTMSLINKLAEIPESIYPDEIITDEMQHSLAFSWEEVYRYFPNALRVGLTATLYHGSLRSFEHLYTDIVQTISKSKSIEDGYITKPLLIVPEQWCQSVPLNGADFDVEVQAEILGEAKIVGNVVDFYKRTFEGRPVIVPCSTYAHAAMMTKAFNDEGWHFEHLHSNLGKHERKRILRSVASGRNNGICTVGIGIEGMSIHGLYGVLWLRRTLSPIIWTQFNGRAERVVDGKDYYVCADFVGNSLLHGMPDRNLQWHLEGEEGAEAQPEADLDPIIVCPMCGVVNSSMNIQCHFCGAVFEDIQPGEGKGRKLPAMVDGRLVVVESDAQESEIEQAAASIQLKQAEERRKEETPQVIDAPEKVEILRSNLFAGGRRKFFQDAVENFL